MISQDEIPAVRHRHMLRVPLFEVDIRQAVYHGNYHHFFELARESFLRDVGYPYRRFMDQQLHLTVVETTCSYRRPLHYDDLIEMHTGVQWLRSRSICLAQLIYREKETGGMELCTRAAFNMVCVRFSGEPAVLPPEFVGLLNAWIEKKTAHP